MIVNESWQRTTAKALSWRFFGCLQSFVICYALTGKFRLSMSISLVELAIKVFTYYFHERMWLKVKWGYAKNRIEDQTCQSKP